MKSLKFSFAAIIAVLAIGVTFAAQAGLFEAKTTRAVDCYTASIADPLAVRAACDTPEDPIVPGVDCSIVSVNDHIFDLSANLVDPALACPGGTKFCCLQIKVDPNPCPGTTQPIFSGSKRAVAAVFCKLN